jgi:hypothetical protein
VNHARRQRDIIATRVAAARSVGRAARERLAALAQAVNAAPAIVPAVNSLIGFGSALDAPAVAPAVAPLVLQRFPSLISHCGPLVQFDVSYESKCDEVVRGLQVASTTIAPLQAEPRCSGCGSTVAYRVVLADRVTTTAHLCLGCTGNGARVATVSQLSALGQRAPCDAYVVLDESAALCGLCPHVCTIAAPLELQVTPHGDMIQHLMIESSPHHSTSVPQPQHDRPVSVTLTSTLLTLAARYNDVNNATLPLLHRLDVLDIRTADAALVPLNFASLQELRLKRCSNITDVSLQNVATLLLLRHLDLSW